MRDRLQLAHQTCGYDLPFGHCQNSQCRHEEFASDDDHYRRRSQFAELDERDESGGDEQLVGDWIGELPEQGGLVEAAGDVAVNGVGNCREHKQSDGKNCRHPGGRTPQDEEHQERNAGDPGEGNLIGDTLKHAVLGLPLCRVGLACG